MRFSRCFVLFIVGVALCSRADAQGAAAGNDSCSRNPLIQRVLELEPSIDLRYVALRPDRWDISYAGPESDAELMELVEREIVEPRENGRGHQGHWREPEFRIWDPYYQLREREKRKREHMAFVSEVVSKVRARYFVRRANDGRRAAFDTLRRLERSPFNRELQGAVVCWLSDPYLLLAFAIRDIALPDIVNDIAMRGARENPPSLRKAIREVLRNREKLEFAALGYVSAHFGDRLRRLPRRSSGMENILARGCPAVGARCPRKSLSTTRAEDLVLWALMLHLRGISPSWDRLSNAAFRAITSGSRRDLFAAENENAFYLWLYEDLDVEDVDAMVRILNEVADRRRPRGRTQENDASQAPRPVEDIVDEAIRRATGRSEAPEPREPRQPSLVAVVRDVMQEARMSGEVSEKVFDLMNPKPAR